MAKKNNNGYVDLKTKPVPEGRHLLEVDNLKMYFHTQDGVVHAVDGVSYTLDRGETLGVVGESGSGKSVTHMTIMGLIDMPPGKIEDGDILYRGESLLEKSEEEMQHIRGNDIAMIFQDPMTSLNPVYKIGRQLGEGLRLHRGYTKQQAQERAIELLRLVGIPNPEKRVNEYPHQFSGGMRQRVMIAMALACDPDILIADEPTTALDVTIQAQILELIYKLRSEFNMAVLLITHDLGVVSEVADRVVVMYCGQVVEEGEKFELFEHPLHPYTLGLLRSIPRLEEQNAGRLYMIKGSVPNPLNMPAGCPFSDRCERCTDRCRTEAPQLKLLPGTTRKVRCHLYEDADEIARAVEATEAAHRVKAELEAQEREIIDQAAQAVRRGSAAQEGVR